MSEQGFLVRRTGGWLEEWAGIEATQLVECKVYCNKLSAKEMILLHNGESDLDEQNYFGFCCLTGRVSSGARIGAFLYIYRMAFSASYAPKSGPVHYRC